MKLLFTKHIDSLAKEIDSEYQEHIVLGHGYSQRAHTTNYVQVELVA